MQAVFNDTDKSKLICTKYIANLIAEYTQRNHITSSFSSIISKLNLSDDKPVAHKILDLIEQKILIPSPEHEIKEHVLVKCMFDRYGIVVKDKGYIWGHNIIVYLIGGDPAFLDAEQEDFCKEHLTPYILNPNL